MSTIPITKNTTPGIRRLRAQPVEKVSTKLISKKEEVVMVSFLFFKDFEERRLLWWMFSITEKGSSSI